MKKHNQLTLGKFIGMLLAVAMLVSLLPVTTYAAFSDVQGHWGQRAIEKWSDMGVLQGSDGAFRPDDPITRGEMAVVIDRVMKYRTKSTNHFSDSGQAFYTDAILKANAAGVIKGDGSTVRPVDNITREEAAVMLGRALGLSEIQVGNTTFSDDASISDWAIGYVYAMTDKGYVKGFNGAFGPKHSITRAEVVAILNNAVKELYDESKEYTGKVSGTAIVNISGAILKDIEISGDLIITEGIGDGDITLNNVKVSGKVLVRGGGADSIHIKGDSQISHLIIEKTDSGIIRIVTSENAVVEKTFVDDGTDDIILSGSWESITISGDVTVEAAAAEINQVYIAGKGAVLNVYKDSVIKELNVTENAADAKITVSGRVEALTADAKVTVTNNGSIATAQINANGVVIEGAKPLKLTFAETVTVTPTTGSGNTSTGSSGSSNNNPFAGGSGTISSPYQVATAAQLNQVRNYLDKHFILTADIDLSGYDNWEPIGAFQSLSDAPEDAEVPKPSVAFTGTFDGDNYTISNVTINKPMSMGVGLFGCTVGTEGNPGSIYDLNVENVNATGYYLVGGVVGLQHTNFTVENVTLTGANAVKGLQGIGGIVGTSFDTVKGCTATADVEVIGDDCACAGVVVGGTTYSSLIDCTAAGGTVTATGNNCWALGGVCGAPYAAPEITNCKAESVTIAVYGANNRLIGGLVGFTGTYGEDDPTSLTDCTVTGASIVVSDSTTCVGGLIGGSKEESSSSNTQSVFAVRDCSTAGAITGGTESVGSIAGYTYDAKVENCSSTMTWNSGSMQHIGKKVAAPAGGRGTEDDPYRIATAEQLDGVRYQLDKHFILTADIDLSGYASWKPIGAFQSLSDAPEDAEVPRPGVAFTGTFDGGNHTISNVTVDEPMSLAVGLFGCAVGTEDNPGRIINLEAENVNVRGYYLAGGIVGLQHQNFTVENATLTGTNQIRGLQGIGGIVGTSFDTVKGCTATADVEVIGDDCACAGVVVGGTTYSSLIDCTAAGGTVTATGNNCWALGGVCGAPYAAPEITNCKAESVTIAVYGANNRLIGGLVGFTGTYGEDDPTSLTDCTVTGASIVVSDSTTCVGGLIGGSKEESSSSNTQSVFAVRDCSTAGAITGGTESVGSIAGYAYNSTVTDCTSTMTWDSSPFNIIGLVDPAH